MEGSPLFLTIDAGTQSLRAMLFTPEGKIVHQVRQPMPPYSTPHPGWVEQDPAYYWQTLCQVCQQLWADTKIDKKRIVSVAVTTKRGTVINLDDKGKPLRPAIIWLDKRRTPEVTPVKGLWGMLFRVMGIAEIIHQLQIEAESNWLRTYQPEIWQKTHKYLFVSGWLNYCLTGEFVDSSASQVGYVPMDTKHSSWAGPRDFKWDALGIKPEMLPKLLPPGSILGPITSQAAEATGIPPNIPVIATAADKACEILGLGVLKPNIGCLSLGTSATINVISTRYIESFKNIPPAIPAAVPHLFCLEYMISRGFWLVNWFKDEFGLREQGLAELLEKLLEQTPPGALGLMLQPYWSPGVLNPGHEAKGAVIGFSEVHTRAHLYRAMIEGIAYGLRQGKEHLEKLCKTKIDHLRVSGGGSQSRSVVQTIANVSGLPVLCPTTHETSSLGAAITSALAISYFNSVEESIKHMCHVRETVQPTLMEQALYNDLYEKIYRKIYGNLKPLYEELQSIFSSTKSHTK